MTLGARDTEALAELKDNGGFKVLMSLMREFEDGIVENMATGREPADLLRVTRFWQCLRSIRTMLEDRPQAALDELQRLKEMQLIDQETGMIHDIHHRVIDPMEYDVNNETPQ